MPFNKYILRFYSNHERLDIEHGIPLNQIGDLMTKLFNALRLKEEDNVTLSGIKNSSYGPEITIEEQDNLISENFEKLHNSIESIDQLKQKKEIVEYAKALNNILTKSRINGIEVYSESREYTKKLEQINFIKSPKFFYEIEEWRGKISEIGGQTINGTRHFIIDGFQKRINITHEQDDLLKDFYKKEMIFVLSVKRSINDESIESIELKDFEPISDEDMYSKIKEIKEKYGDILNEIDDPVEYIRELRHTRNKDNDTENQP